MRTSPRDASRAAPHRTPRRRRRLFVLVSFLIALLLLWNGWPQRALVRGVLGRALQATIQVDDLTIGREIHIEGFGAYDTPEDKARDRPVFRTHDMWLECLMRPTDGRHFPQLYVPSANVCLDLAAADTNYDFLTALLTQPRTAFDPLPYLPKRIVLDDLEITVATAQGSLAVDGLDLFVSMDDMSHLAAMIDGPSRIGWSHKNAPDRPITAQGSLQILLSYGGSPASIAGRLTAEFPDLLDSAGCDIKAQFLGDGTRIEGEIDKLTIHGGLFYHVDPNVLPFPVRFDRIDASRIHVAVLLAAGRLKSLSADGVAAAHSLVIGTPEKELYAGDLAVEGHVQDARGDLTATLGHGQRVQVAMDGLPPQGVVKMTLDNWSRDDIRNALPKDWRHFLDAMPALSGLSARVAIKGSEQSYQAEFAVEPRLVLPDTSNSDGFETKLDGAVSLTDAFSRATSRAINLHIGEWADAAVTSLSAVTDPFAVQGTFACHFDFNRAPASSAVGSWTGQAEIHAPIHYKNGSLTAALDIRGTGLGYGQFVPSADTPSALTAELTFDPASGNAHAASLQATWGRATRATVESLEYANGALRGPIAFALETDLEPLVVLGSLAAVDHADVKLKGIWMPGGDGLTVAFDAVHIGSLALSDNRALFTGFELEGKAANATAWNGDGLIKAAETLAMGAVLRNMRAQWKIRDGVFESDNLEGQLFGGRFRAVVQQSLAAPFNGNAAVEIEGVDLARFTEEYKPPRASLTGAVDGKLDLRWNRDELGSLHIELRSSQGFSINRDLLEWLLVSNYIEGLRILPSSKKEMRRVLGDDPQRPFDSAELVLDKVADRYVGQAPLRSKVLDLTIDLTVDEKAILEGLRVRQKAHLEDIANVRTEKVE